MTDFAYLILDNSTPQALAGDYSLLIKRLRGGKTLHPDEREFLANHLEGKPLKKGRKKSTRTRLLDNLVCDSVYWLTQCQGIGLDAAQVTVAEALGETDRNVRTRLKRATGIGIRHAVIDVTWEMIGSEFSREEVLAMRPILLRNVKGLV